MKTPARVSRRAGVFYAQYRIQENPGKRTNTLAGVGENAYSRDAPTSPGHVHSTTRTILVS